MHKIFYCLVFYHAFDLNNGKNLSKGSKIMCERKSNFLTTLVHTLTWIEPVPATTTTPQPHYEDPTKTCQSPTCHQLTKVSSENTTSFRRATSPWGKRLTTIGATAPKTCLLPRSNSTISYKTAKTHWKGAWHLWQCLSYVNPCHWQFHQHQWQDQHHQTAIVPTIHLVELPQSKSHHSLLKQELKKKSTQFKYKQPFGNKYIHPKDCYEFLDFTHPRLRKSEACITIVVSRVYTTPPPSRLIF